MRTNSAMWISMDRMDPIDKGLNKLSGNPRPNHCPLNITQYDSNTI